METNKKSAIRAITVRTLTESALLVALATVLSLYAVYKLPNGGSITACSMIPIVLVSFKYPFGWSAAVAFTYALIQMLLGFYAPPVETFVYYALVVLLDYIVAFGVLCLAGPAYRSFPKATPVRVRLTAAAILCFALRFACHYLSGIIIWGAYAPPDQPVWLYSLLYNGSYMLGECVVSGVIMFAIGKKLMKYFVGDMA